jgi:hypothetical protein
MKITLKMLLDKDACDKLLLLFIEHFCKDGSPDHTEILQKLDEQKHPCAYGGWLLENFGLSGTSTWWHKSGVKLGEIPYVNGKAHGVATGWYRNGVKHVEILYVNGKRHGIETWWYENGVKHSEIPYVNGKAHGVITGWYRNGVKEGEIPCVNGERHGIATFWDRNGDFDEYYYYINNERVSKEEWEEYEEDENRKAEDGEIKWGSIYKEKYEKLRSRLKDLLDEDESV